jgi:hypothetical protein
MCSRVTGRRCLAKKIRNWETAKWTERWEVYKDAIPKHSRTPIRDNSIAVQLQGGKNGFNDFLYSKAKVSGVRSARCSCGWRK